MFEFLFLIGAVLLVGALCVGLLKLLLLPLKLGLWIVKGVIGLVLLVPALVLSVWAFTTVVPIAIVVLLVPVMCLFAGLVVFLSWFF